MFSVDLHVRKCGDNVIVALSGELDIVDAADVAAGLVAAAAGRGPTIVDLAGLTFIDCRGAAALVRAQRRVRRAGGNLLLAAPQSRVRRVFELSRLIDGVCLHPSVTQAASQGSAGAEISSGPRTMRPPYLWRRASARSTAEFGALGLAE